MTIIMHKIIKCLLAGRTTITRVKCVVLEFESVLMGIESGTFLSLDWTGALTHN